MTLYEYDQVDLLAISIGWNEDTRNELIREQREKRDFVEDCIQWHQTDLTHLKEVKDIAEEAITTLRQKLDCLVEESKAEITKLHQPTTA